MTTTLSQKQQSWLLGPLKLRMNVGSVLLVKISLGNVRLFERFAMGIGSA